MGWDAGWRMQHTHCVAPCPCLLLPRSRCLSACSSWSSTSRSRASSPLVFELESIVGVSAKPRRGCAVQVRRRSRARIPPVVSRSASECACRRLFVAGPRSPCTQSMGTISGVFVIFSPSSVRSCVSRAHLPNVRGALAIRVHAILRRGVTCVWALP